jgi:hypothetical protein
MKAGLVLGLQPMALVISVYQGSVGWKNIVYVFESPSSIGFDTIMLNFSLALRSHSLDNCEPKQSQGLLTVRGARCFSLIVAHLLVKVAILPKRPGPSI